MRSPAETKAWFQAYHLRNKVRRNAAARQYYRDNREKVLERHRVAKHYLMPHVKEYCRKYNAEHKEAVTKMKLKSLFKQKYHLSYDDYTALLASQNGVCAICRNFETVRPRLSVDHSHSTGKLRALLCHSCNVGLGHFRDSVGLLQDAAKYLEKYAEK